LKNLEIVTGTGRFASVFRVGLGIEPAQAVAKLAKQCSLEVVLGVAEHLPFNREQFDLVLIVAAIFLFENLSQALR